MSNFRILSVVGSAWLWFFCKDILKFARSNLHWDIKIFAKKTVTFEKSQESLLRDLKLYRPRSVDFGGCIQPFHDLNLRGSYTLDWNRYQPPTWIGRFREVYTAVPRPKSKGFIRTHHKMSRKTTWNTHLKQSMQGGSYRGCMNPYSPRYAGGFIHAKGGSYRGVYEPLSPTLCRGVHTLYKKKKRRID